MLDLHRMRRIKLSGNPRGQRLIGASFLATNYNLPPRVKIAFEEDQRLGEAPVIYAMNHTDRYNYWPFQYRLWRTRNRFTATWVKGKYYESRFVGKFMEMTNNIPIVSRGYLIARDFMTTLKRRPQSEEYRYLRNLVNATAGLGEPPVQDDSQGELGALFDTPRDILGRPFDPTAEAYPNSINSLFGDFMRVFVELHEQAFERGLDLLVFPQGTRSKRLSRGHIGLAQIALKFQRTIVPVGCNGSDRCYPAGSPWAKGGEIVYRFGEPISYSDMAPFHVDPSFVPFTPGAEGKHREAFQGLVDLVMDRINGLLDEPYQYSTERDSDGVRGTDRFV